MRQTFSIKFLYLILAFHFIINHIFIFNKRFFSSYFWASFGNFLTLQNSVWIKKMYINFSIFLLGDFFFFYLNFNFTINFDFHLIFILYSNFPYQFLFNIFNTHQLSIYFIVDKTIKLSFCLWIPRWILSLWFIIDHFK